MKPVTHAEASRRYRLQFWIAMVVYAVVLFGSIEAARLLSGPAHLAVSLLPVVPVAWLFFACVQYVASVDELTRTIQVTSLAIAGGLTALLSVTYGFLETTGLPHPSAWVTYITFMATWAIVTPFVARRYQ